MVWCGVPCVLLYYAFYCVMHSIVRCCVILFYAGLWCVLISCSWLRLSLCDMKSKSTFALSQIIDTFWFSFSWCLTFPRHGLFRHKSSLRSNTDIVR